MSSLRARLERAAVNADSPVVPTKELSQDPDKLLEAAMAAEVAPTEAVVTPTPEVVVPTPPPAPVEKRFEYQNHDEQGRPIGGVQVILYTDEEDLKRKVAAKEEQLVRRLREVTRKQKLGIADESLPDGTELAVFETPQPRQLSAEERFQLSQDINDPEKSIAAINTILEASVGYTAEQMRQQFDDARMAKLQNQAFVNYKVFEQSATDFYPTADNAKLLTDWMFSKRLAPTVKNYELAFSTLHGAGLLQAAPTVREVTPAPAPAPAPAAVMPAPAPSTELKPVVPAETVSRIAPPEPPQQQRQPVRVPSGLNARTASDSGPTSVGTTLTLAEFDAMPADELKKRLKDPVFAKQVNELYEKKPIR